MVEGSIQGHLVTLRDDTSSLSDRGELPACGGGEKRVRSSHGGDDPGGRSHSVVHSSSSVPQ